MKTILMIMVLTASMANAVDFNEYGNHHSTAYTLVNEYGNDVAQVSILQGKPCIVPALPQVVVD